MPIREELEKGVQSPQLRNRWRKKKNSERKYFSGGIKKDGGRYIYTFTLARFRKP